MVIVSSKSGIQHIHIRIHYIDNAIAIIQHLTYGHAEMLHRQQYYHNQASTNWKS